MLLNIKRKLSLEAGSDDWLKSVGLKLIGLIDLN